MHELKEKLKPIGEIKQQLVDAMKAEMSQGLRSVNTEEAGQVTDMIKDLAETEEKCWKAKYYCKIIEAMEEAKKEEELMAKVMKLDMDKVDPNELRQMMQEMRMGYDHWRRSDGEYAPKGTGHYSGGRMGYIPMPMDPEPWDAPWYMDIWNKPYMARMGFPNGMSGNSGSSSGGRGGSRGSSGGRSGRSGYDGDQMGGQSQSPRDRYNDARRYFTQTGSPESRQQMTEEAKMCIDESIEAMRDIWVDAEPELQEKLKRDLMKLGRELGIM